MVATTTAASGQRSVLARHPLAAFVALTYLISWAWWIPLVLAGGAVRQGVGWPTQIPGLMGPAIAAVVVTWRVEGRTGLRRLWRSVIDWRVGWWWLVVPVTLGAGAVGLLVGAAPITASDLTAYNGIPVGIGALLTIAIVFVCNGIGEETGWRGFAVARLLRGHSPVSTSLIVALIWAPWHLPLFFLMESFEAFTVGEIVGWLLGLTAGSILFTWMFAGSGGSVLLVAAWHTAFNFTSATPAASGPAAAITSTLVMVVAVVVVIVDVRRRLTTRAGAGLHA
jgi:CAAX protease family protein